MMNTFLKYCLLVSIVLTALSGCKRDPLPKDALQRDKFIEVLIDVHLAEALYTDRYRFKMDSLRSEPLYKAVLEKHGVSEDQLNKTILYYTRHPRDYDKIYSEVLSQISQKLEESDKKDEVDVN